MNRLMAEVYQKEYDSQIREISLKIIEIVKERLEYKEYHHIPEFDITPFYNGFKGVRVTGYLKGYSYLDMDENFIFNRLKELDSETIKKVVLGIIEAVEEVEYKYINYNIPSSLKECIELLEKEIPEK